MDTLYCCYFDIKEVKTTPEKTTTHEQQHATTSFSCEKDCRYYYYRKALPN